MCGAVVFQCWDLSSRDSEVVIESEFTVTANFIVIDDFEVAIERLALQEQGFVSSLYEDFDKKDEDNVNGNLTFWEAEMFLSTRKALWISRIAEGCEKVGKIEFARSVASSK